MRYHIGIDLGTTNCALSYVDTLRPELGVRVLEIPQWSGQERFLEYETLPSFVYFPLKAEWKKGQLNVPGFPYEDNEPASFALGHYARELSLPRTARVAHSAKSWLASRGVDRKGAILPWNSDEVTGDDRKSPVMVSSMLLTHLKKAWEAGPGFQNPDGVFENQVITIGIPASFDEMAQRLTLEAALASGYPESVALCEEPLSAFHLYLSEQPTVLTDFLANQKKVVILVCDIGGGTTDFSLFEILRFEDRLPEVVRTKVSSHLLLGGDNIDLLIAKTLEPRFGVSLPLKAGPWGQLLAAARRLKEDALSQGGDETLRVSISMGTGSLFASSKTATITRQEICDLIVNAFLPFVSSDSLAGTEEILAGLGLPYAKETAFTKHIAHFLDGAKVDACLFAGGSVKPAFMRARILEVLGAHMGKPLYELETTSFDLAIAKGCALSPKQKGLIKGGYPRTIYLEVLAKSGESKFVCMVPRGFDGSKIVLKDLSLKVMVGVPRQFQIYTESSGGEVVAGESYDRKEGCHKLPALVTRLEAIEGGFEGEIEVFLEVHLSASGLLDIFCVSVEDSSHRWQLSFPTRVSDSVAGGAAAAACVSAGAAIGAASGSGSGRGSGAASDMPASGEAGMDRDSMEKAGALFQKFYGKSRGQKEEPKQLVQNLEEVLAAERGSWDVFALRQLWQRLGMHVTRRGRSKTHEAQYLYLAGFFLRPGYGDAYDSYRLEKLWPLFAMGLSFPKDARVKSQWWMMWRRVCGGLDKKKQELIFKKIYPAIKKDQDVCGEMILLAGALERVDVNLKSQLGKKLVEQIIQKKSLTDQRIWALARIASRLPLYAGAEAILRASVVESFAKELSHLSLSHKVYKRLALFYASAGRYLGQRELDVSLEWREHFFARHEECGGPLYARAPLLEKVAIDYKDQNQIFGEELPNGLFFE